MKAFTAQTADPDAIVKELLHGGGAVKISGLFTPAQIADHSGATAYVSASQQDLHNLTEADNLHAKAGNAEGRT